MLQLEKNDRIITNADFERLTNLKEINEETIRALVDDVINAEISEVRNLTYQIKEFKLKYVDTFDYNVYRNCMELKDEFQEVSGIFEKYRRERAELIAEYVEYHRLKKKWFWRWLFKRFG